MSAHAREPLRPRLMAVDGREMPHDPDAEAAVLSAVLTDARALDELAGVVSAGDFYGDAHRRIFEAAVELHAAGGAVDITTVAGALRGRSGGLEAVGGVAYLAKLLDKTPAVAHVAAHGRIVREQARLRAAIDTMRIGLAEAYAPEARCDVGAFLERLEGEVFALAQGGRAAEGREMLAYDLARETVMALSMARDGGRPVGLPTGFHDIDARTGGLRDGNLWIVAGRPGMGKTACALGLAASVAARVDDAAVAAGATRIGVQVFSLEMSREEVMHRLIASEGRVDLKDIAAARLTEAQWDRVTGAANALAQLPLWVDDTAAATLAHVRATVRRKKAAFDRRRPDGTWERRIGLVIIDYLQLMGTPRDERTRTQNREQDVSALTRGLKALAKEVACPIVVLSQLNRAVEGRAEKRPSLADLRESGAIEQDADVVGFLFRPEYYLEQASKAVPAELRGFAEFILGKQRNGPTGSVGLTFVAPFVRFENRSRDAAAPNGEADERPHADGCRCSRCGGGPFSLADLTRPGRAAP